MPRASSERPVRIGVSACLLGAAVRYDGGHKRDSFLMGTLDPFVEWVPVCPEVEVGLGTPRPSLRLERHGDEVRMVVPSQGKDLTAAMRAHAARRAAEMERLDLCGYVLKKDSPSCGMERVKVYAGGAATRNGRGLYAQALMERLPDLPVEEEGRLGDARLRENFIRRVFAYHRLRGFFAGRWTVGGLVAFHATQKLSLMAHSAQAYASLGRLVARAKGMNRAQVARTYVHDTMTALSRPATARRHVNVLQHMLGYFSGALPPEQRAEMVTLIEDYRQGLVPLIVPLTLVKHHVRRLGVSYLLQQVYLEPHPKELLLLNHV
ncbi:MAG TPA: DUF523 and DUF1722 domain-containing protein [Vicinamibacteria bacterium]|nr:DUF523 and DUF1722 domain-containing protein [Vicinamibacteria bacterium]